jgi:hypothetical protein
MTLLAGLAVGVFVYFLVGFATGYAPEIKIRRFRPRKQISNRQLWLNQAGVEVANTPGAQGRRKPSESPRAITGRSIGATSAGSCGSASRGATGDPRRRPTGAGRIRAASERMSLSHIGEL